MIVNNNLLVASKKCRVGEDRPHREQFLLTQVHHEGRQRAAHRGRRVLRVARVHHATLRLANNHFISSILNRILVYLRN